MITSFLTDKLARQAAERAALTATHNAEIEDEIQLRVANIMAELQGIRELGSIKPGRAEKLIATPKKGAKRSPGELETLTKILLRYISKHPWQRIEQIAAGLGHTTKSLNLPIKKLIADKSISTRGHKRATAYCAK
ncbi:MAG TPA: hypothetical protein VGJ84_09920 [Polyangiaceae bacterium]